MTDPATITAITAVIFNKAIEKGAENLSEAVFNKASQIISTVRDKFRGIGMEGVLTQARENPTEPNQRFFQQALEMQMNSDTDFRNKLKDLIDEIKSDEKASAIFFKGIKIEGSAELGDLEMESKEGNMEAVVDAEIGGDFKMGNISMKNNG